jgi:hypothetical protein
MEPSPHAHAPVASEDNTLAGGRHAPVANGHASLGTVVALTPRLARHLPGLDLPHSDGGRGPEADAKAAKRARKRERAQDSRELEPWERYRAIGDLHDTYMDIAELLDRKTRFALLIMGALNAVNLLLAARPDLLAPPAARGGSWFQLYVASYAILSLYLFLQAIIALRPRPATFSTSDVNTESMLGLRFTQRVASRSARDYYDTWCRARVGDLNRETALQAQVLSRMVIEKYAAIDRIYKGLAALTLITAGQVTVLAYLGFVG